MSDKREAVGFVSGGRDPNHEPVCSTCVHQQRDRAHPGWGWCQHPNNRVPPSDGWPTGFAPSVSPHGGCNLHPTAQTQEQQ